jgi:hypothetical protein
LDKHQMPTPSFKQEVQQNKKKGQQEGK